MNRQVAQMANSGLDPTGIRVARLWYAAMYPPGMAAVVALC